MLGFRRVLFFEPSPRETIASLTHAFIGIPSCVMPSQQQRCCSRCHLRNTLRRPPNVEELLMSK